MIRWIFSLFTFASLNALADEPILSATAIGNVAFGSKLSDAEDVLKERAHEEEEYADESCHYVSFKAFPGSLLMIQHSLVMRADAAAGVSNTLGVTAGMTMEAVLRAHPEAQVTKHHYDPDGFYLTFPSTDGKAAIVMEVGGAKITDIRAGLRPSVDYVEGCL